MLLGPAAAELKNKRLLIVSDGVLQFIPFAGLPDPTNSRPLIVDHEIVTAPSASVVALLRQETANRKPAAKTFAVFADPVFSNDDPRVAHRRLAHAAPDEKNSRRTLSDQLPNRAWAICEGCGSVVRKQTRSLALRITI